MRARVDEYEDLIGQQPIFRDRTRGIGVITPEFARQMGLTGPNARASGVNWDLRAHEPYGAYREIQVQPIVLENGDVYDRYLIRLLRDAAVARHHRAGCSTASRAGPGSRTTARSCCRRATSCTPRWSR